MYLRVRKLKVDIFAHTLPPPPPPPPPRKLPQVLSVTLQVEENYSSPRHHVFEDLFSIKRVGHVLLVAHAYGIIGIA